VLLAGGATGTIQENDGASEPTFSIDDVTQNEGDAGTTSYTFTVIKSGDTELSSSVDYETVNGTAADPGDFTAITATTLIFGPTDTSIEVTVLVNGDTTSEANEAFTVHLSNASGATISDADGTGTITNDDAAPSFTIDDVTQNEGDAGTTSYTFTVTKTGSTKLSSSVDYETVNGSASAPSDYTALPLTTLTFGPTDTSMPVTVLVNGDIAVEPNEDFTVHLSNAINATISDADGTGTITNDDVHVAPVVTNTNDSGPNSLRQALLDAEDGDTISFNIPTSDPGFSAGVWTITLTSGQLVVDRDVTINGTGANVLTVRRDPNASGFRIFYVNSDGPEVVASNPQIVTSTGVTIRGLTISNGLPQGPFPQNAGGGIYNDHTVLTVGSCTLSDNSATSDSIGGGILNDGGGTGSATLTVVNSTLSGNTAGFGGGIFNSGIVGNATLTVVNSTLSGNSAFQWGGGAIYNDGQANGSAALIITNSTLSGNSAADGGGIYNEGAVAATTQIGNTIMKAGVSGSNIFNGVGTVTSLGYNLSSDDGGGSLTATGDQINTDPILGPLQNNGGPTFTHASLSNSPAIDMGKDIGATGQDQRGSVRPVTYDVSITPPSGGDRSDIGAVELPPRVIPTGAVSRKTHGAAGPFDVNLPLVPISGAVGIEDRSGGVNGDYRIVVSFVNPVTVSGSTTPPPSAATMTGTGTVSSITVAESEVTVNLTGVTDMQRITVTLLNVSDGTSTNNIDVSMGVLIGDVQENGSVSAGDIGFTKQQSSPGTVTASNFRTDINANGAVNAADIAMVKSKSGDVLPP
jgi:hypothetical protein